MTVQMESLQTLTADIERETKAIWTHEPVEISRLRLGVIPTEAGSWDQYFSTAVFALIYVLCLGQHMVYDSVKAADNPKVDLQSLKAVTYGYLRGGFESPMFLGYVLAPKAHEFANRIAAQIDAAQGKETIRDLFATYLTYLNALHVWVHLIFPWYLGVQFPQITKQKFEEIQRLMPQA